MELKEYELKSGIFDRKRKLRLSPDYVQYDNQQLAGRGLTQIKKADIIDFKHGMDWIVWYKFYVGRKFMITFKTVDKKELKIVFTSLFGINSHFNQVYADIVEDIWQYYHQDIVDRYLNKLYSGEELTIKNLRLNQKGIQIDQKSPLLGWNRVSLKEYYSYFAIHDNDNPDVHKRISYNEYETEILWGMIKSILEESRFNTGLNAGSIPFNTV